MSLMSSGGTNKKYTTVYLGSQATSGWNTTPFTADIKKLYPNIYSKLTRSNFYAVPFRWFGNSAANSGNEGNAGDNISYNPVSGIMKGYGTNIGPGGTWAGSLIYKFYMVY